MIKNKAMKALIITYYWPPSGGSGVQRWLKFAKYLRDYGIEPVVYTAKNADYPVIDKTLEKDIPKGIEVLKQPIWEPYKLSSFFLGRNKKGNENVFIAEKNKSFLGKVVTYIRANYFIPDARMFWIRPSVNFLLNYLKKNKIDVIITTGPPHSMHLIGLKLKQKLGIKWIADFRDPWTKIDYYERLPLTKLSNKKHHRQEQKVLKNSDAIIVIGNEMKKQFLPYKNKISVITNGYDKEIIKNRVELDKKFTISHIGIINEDRNPEILWKALSQLIKENKDLKADLKIRFIGNTSRGISKSVSNYGLEKNMELKGYLSHNEVMEYQLKSQVLLIIVSDVRSAKTIITGKVFEYLIAKRPILAIAPTDGDLAKIINDTNAGIVINYDDKEKIKSTVLDMYQKYKQGKLAVNSKNIEKYHRKELTDKLSEIIKNI